MGQAVRPCAEGRARRAPPLVSVVIPCFDQAHFLAEAIESVFAQTFGDLELLVVDDGSLDNSYEVACRYPDVRPLRQANRGVAAARNLGLAESRGTFSVFLDADDRLLPQALGLGMEALVKRPQIAFAAGMSKDIREDGRPIDGAHRQPLVSQDHYLRLLEDCYIWSGSSVVYRRAAVEAVGGFNESLAAADDYELYLKLARRYPVYCHDAVVTEYRRHGSNTTRNAAVVLTSQLEVLGGQRSQLRGRRERAARRRGIRKTRAEHGRALAEQVAASWRRRRRRRAMRELLTLVRHDPGALLGFAGRAA
jgi:glycosyltransferase involved in cell wall biosynthesis